MDKFFTPTPGPKSTAQRSFSLFHSTTLFHLLYIILPFRRKLAVQFQFKGMPLHRSVAKRCKYQMTKVQNVLPCRCCRSSARSKFRHIQPSFRPHARTAALKYRILQQNWKDACLSSRKTKAPVSLTIFIIVHQYSTLYARRHLL